MSEYVDKIGSLMSLKESLPSSLREQLGPDSSELKQMAMEFAPLCVKLRIWSFVETIDSSLDDISVPGNAEGSTPMKMKVRKSSGFVRSKFRKDSSS
jgi:hypothetical protein